jgi:hypothetical protein
MQTIKHKPENMKQPIQHTVRKSLIRGSAALAALAFPAMCVAANVTMNASDGIGTSSFNSAGHWDSLAAPTSGNDYFTSTFRLRTPADGNSYTFAGNSLTINATGGAPGDLLGLSYKGLGTAGTLTVNNLILNGGAINHLNGIGDRFQLAGNINVAADSYIYAKQGEIDILANISGSAKITNPGSDLAGCTLKFLSGANTFTGSIVNNGRFELADNANLNYTIGLSGVNNSFSGTGAASLFNGDFNFNLSGAGSGIGDSWSIITAANSAYGSTFSVMGFSDLGGGLWDTTANGAEYQFNTANGILSVVAVPEPSTFALAGIGLAALLIFRRPKSV